MSHEYVNPILQDGIRVDAAAVDGQDAPIIATDKEGHPVFGDTLEEGESDGR